MNFTVTVKKKLCLIIVYFIIGCFTAAKSDNLNSKSQALSHQEYGAYGQPFKLPKLGYEAIGIETTVLRPKPLPNYLSAIGKIESVPSRQYFVHSVANGHITKVLVVLGQYVHTGDVLVEYESPDINELSSSLILNKQGIEAQIQQLETNFQDEIKEASAQVDLAKQNFERDNVLFKEKIGSQKSLQTSKAYLEISESKYKVALEKRDLTLKAMHTKLQLTLEPIIQKLKLLGASDSTINKIIQSQNPIAKIVLKSPANGDIIFQNATCGQSISPGVRLFVICNEKEVWASANINENDIAKINLNDKVEAFVNSYPDIKFTGKIVFLNHDLDPQTRTLSVRALLNNDQEILRPEMFTNLKIYLHKPIYSLIVPTDAVVERNGHSYAFTLDKGIFQSVRVQTGQMFQDNIEIKAGIQPNTTIVTKGAFQLLANVLKTQGFAELFNQPTEGDRAYDKDEIADQVASHENNWLSIILYLVCLILGSIIGGYVVQVKLKATSQQPQSQESIVKSSDKLNNK